MPVTAARARVSVTRLIRLTSASERHIVIGGVPVGAAIVRGGQWSYSEEDWGGTERLTTARTAFDYYLGSLEFAK